LIPILDAVFIFIFFLLMSANFIKIFEIQSAVPIISTGGPKSKKKPLALTLDILDRQINVSTGVPGKVVKVIKKNAENEYNYEELRQFMVKLKKRNVKERDAVLIPVADLDYQTIVKVMDAVRTYKNTDEDISYRDKDGVDVKVKALFDKIVFGNIGR
jgi:biopolymer transport protein ExbD